MLALMVKEIELNNKQSTSAQSKTCYSKPKLEKLGYVREMTLAGSANANESVGSDMCVNTDFKSNINCT